MLDRLIWMTCNYRNLYIIHLSSICLLYIFREVNVIGERIRKARKAAGLLQVDLAVAMGDRYDPGTISRVEAGKSSLRLDGLARAARELGVSTDYLLGLTDDPMPYAKMATRLAELDTLKHELTGAASPLHDLEALGQNGQNPDNTRYVEVHEVEAAAGSGRLIEDAPVIGHLAFQRDWLKRHRIDPDQCTVIGVDGDSMEPTLPDGCSILVDHSRRSRRRGKIYVLQAEDGLIVKRAGREKSGWRILSDNPYWPPAPWPEGARIIGEVRWTARTF